MPSDPHSDAYNTGLWLKRINVRLKKSPVTNGFLIWRKKKTLGQNSTKVIFKSQMATVNILLWIEH